MIVSFYLNRANQVVKQIMFENGESSHFLVFDESPIFDEYLVWLAEGNTPEPWQPEEQ